MKLRCLHPKTFSSLFEVLKENVTDNLIHFHPDSIKLRATDTAKTCMTFVNIHGNALDQYECERYQPVAVNIPNMWTVLKMANSDDVLQMEFDNQKETTLNICIVDSKTGQPHLETSYITLQCDEDALPIPDNITCDHCISMGSLKFYTDLKKLENMKSEYVKLRQCKSPSGGYRLQLIGMGSQFHRNPVINTDEFAHTENVNLAPAGSASSGTAPKAPVAELQELEMCFPLKKLATFAKAHCLDAKVSIYLDPRGCLILQYKIDIYGELRFVVMKMNDETKEDDDDDDDDDEDDEDDAPNGKKRARVAEGSEEDE